jgi:hypothetical protein
MSGGAPAARRSVMAGAASFRMATTSPLVKRCRAAPEPATYAVMAPW